MNNFKVGEIVQRTPADPPLIYLGLQLNGRASCLTDDGRVEDHRIEDLQPFTPRTPILVVFDEQL